MNAYKKKQKTKKQKKQRIEKVMSKMSWEMTDIGGRIRKIILLDQA